MRTPKFSIIIPIRNRASTLKYTLKTCINQKYFDDYEIVVCDNCSDDNIMDVIDECYSNKIRYVRTEKPLLMQDSFNFAVDNANGDYLIMLGSDDGLSTYALYFLDKIINITKEKMITWKTVDYYWPECLVKSNKLYMYYFQDENKLENGEEFNNKYASGKFIGRLPALYCRAVIHRDIIEQVKVKTGKHIHDSAQPDTYAALVCSQAATKFIRIKLFASIYAESKFGVATNTFGKSINKLKRNQEDKENRENVSISIFEPKYRSGIFKKTTLYAPISDLITCIDLKERFYPALKDVKLNYKSAITETIKEIEKRVSFHGEIDDIINFIDEVYTDICNSDDKSLKEWFEEKFLHKYDNVTIEYFKKIKNEDNNDEYFYKDTTIIDGNNCKLRNVYDAVKFLDNMFYSKDNLDSYLNLYEQYWNKAKHIIEKISDNSKGEIIGIYGTGNHSEILLETYKYFKDKIDFNIVFINSDSTKWGKQFMGYDIYSPNDIKKLNLKKIVISSYDFQDDMYNNLIEYKEEIEIIKIYEPGDVCYLKRINNR